MDLHEAEERVLLGEPLESIAAAYREELLQAVGLRADEASSTTFRDETRRFMGRLSRQLAERHAGDHRARLALEEWVQRVTDYDAWDALLSTYEFDGKPQLIRRGRLLFPGPLTAHW